MARTLKLDGVEPKRLLTIKTNLTWANVPGGHANAGKAMAFGTIAGGAVVGADNLPFLGKLILLERDGLATIQTMGVVKVPSSGSIEAGDQVVCAASGAVKKYAPDFETATAIVGRGRVLPVDAGTGFVYVEL